MRQAPIRWGIIGTGLIANCFAKDLQVTDSGLVVAVGSRSRDSADRFANNYDIPNRHDSYEALVSDPDVDVVYVATPHPMHHANAVLALEAGKPVLVEKAFTMNAAEARDLVSIARSRGLFLMEAMWMRFLPHFAELNRLLADNSLGELVTVTADHGQWFAKDAEFRLFAPKLGGGALLDLGVYTVSFASMVLGKPDQITSVVTEAFTGVDGQTSMVFGYANGAQALLNCTLSAMTPTIAAIVGTEARIEIEAVFYEPTAFRLTGRDGVSKRFEPPHTGGGLHYEADEVARCIREGLSESPLMPLDESIEIMETMDAVMTAALSPLGGRSGSQ